MTPTISRIRAATGVVMTLMAPSALRGQTRVELTPYVGILLPASSIASGTGSTCGCPASLHHQTEFLFGQRVGFHVSSRVLLEGTLAYSASGVAFKEETVGGVDTVIRAHITFLNIHALYVTGGATASTAVHLMGGLGLVMRGGDAYAGATGTSDLALVVGLGARVKLKPSRLVLRADVEDNSSPAKFGSADDPGAATASKGQHDFVVSMGLSIPL